MAGARAASTAREEILARIRGALHDVPHGEQPTDVTVPRDYRRSDDTPAAELAERFALRVSDYRATVTRIPITAIAAAVLDACVRLGLRRLVVPPALPAQWRPEGVEVIEDHLLPAAQLDSVDGAITGCAAAIAETGTNLLDGRGASGRRAVTLVPDHLICIVTEDQIVGLVPEGSRAWPMRRPCGGCRSR